jgi:hypothetical protein
MIGRVLLVSLLAISACKKKDNAGDPPSTGTPTSGTPSTGTPTTGTPTGTPTTTDTPTTPSGDKRVNDSPGWSPQTGPGFTVNAPGPAKIEKVPAHDGDRAFDRYTFHKTDTELYVVEVTEIPAKDDLGMALNNMRMRITTQTQSVRSEDLIEGGEVTGRDIRYIVDQGDDTLHARSKVLGKNQKLYEVRGVAAEDKAREAEADKFVDSFELAP